MKGKGMKGKGMKGKGKMKRITPSRHTLASNGFSIRRSKRKGRGREKSERGDEGEKEQTNNSKSN